MVKVINEYNPDYVFPPGATLMDVLVDLDMTQTDLANRMGRPIKTINEIIKGKTAITPETALQLENVLKISASLWNNMEKDYREYLARVEEEQKIKENINWLKTLPINEMIKKGWIQKYKDKMKQFVEVLKFFAISSPEQLDVVWNKETVAFRESKTFKSNKEAIYVWLRKGELEAQKIDCLKYNSKHFKKALDEIRLLTNESPEIFIPKIQELCAKTGVAVVFIPQIKGITTSGATRWLSPRKAIIQLNLRYKTNDHFWFTFFHEAGHILLHKKKMMFIEGFDIDKQLEEEANKFAANILINEKKYLEFIEANCISRTNVIQFAKSIDIASGIVVGRLQRDEYLPYSHLNKLKIKLKWNK